MALAQRLALAKAQAVAKRFPQAIVIGSDQVADLNGEPLGKPGNHANAVKQLQKMQSQFLPIGQGQQGLYWSTYPKLPV